ncbi:trehalose-6-phosphate synthase [Longibacter salinarum]|uniref:Trehalose-6-phosphate synthase n=1 Tax=Longibacter salinarum TaxID=1850348 RepID=A0A2A8D142_9BACT|nr:trehalose-6-phosphate synthase [Longibacter salinarum]PEN14682.1 trehalose-6-phosphate synthase [Longibacter salinarum]
MSLTVVANRVPIRKTDDGWKTSVGGLTTALLPVLEEQGGVWVGMGEDPDLPECQQYPEDDPDFLVRRVPLSDEELDNYYYGMANRVLWPVSHYLIQHLELRERFIDTYRSVNERFAKAVLDESPDDPDEIIWIQDYHLMLAPRHIRDARPDAVIGHFWHIPWPAMEVFRILPWSRELLRGMLGCDLIGFHVDEYVDNFIESAEVLLGADVTENTVTLDGHTTRVEAHPIGIEVDRFKKMAATEEVKEKADKLRNRLGTDNIVIGIDRLDYTKGILSRLTAFEQFLEENPDYHGKVSFYQIATPSRTKVESYQQLKREVDEAVGRINGQFARDNWVPVNYRYRTYTQFELCAFYRAADAALITPLRDGMNVVTQEFITATQNGALILSELTGAAYLLPEAIQVNPYDQGGLADAIKVALEMPDEERRSRLKGLKSTVEKLDVHKWAQHFLDSFDR